MTRRRMGNDGSWGISTPMPLAGHDVEVFRDLVIILQISTPMPLAGHDPIGAAVTITTAQFLLPCPSRGMTKGGV